MNSVPPARTPVLRLSHAVLALAAIHQLIGSEFMEPPWEFDHASATQQWMFELHEWVGLTAGAALLALLFTLWRRYAGGLRAHFLPWIGATGRSTLIAQARAAAGGLIRRHPLASTEVPVLSASWEGFGLLTMAFLATTGASMALLEDSAGLVQDLAEIHELGALPLKIYIGGHAGIALVHEWRGEGLIRRMGWGRQRG